MSEHESRTQSSQRRAGTRVALWVACALAFAALGPRSASARASQASSAASEKQLLATFQTAFEAQDPAQRVTALAKLGEDSRQLGDHGTSKAVAKALVKGLEDAEIEVRNAAVGQLTHGRDVDTVVGGLDTLLRDT